MVKIAIFIELKYAALSKRIPWGQYLCYYFTLITCAQTGVFLYKLMIINVF